MNHEYETTIMPGDFDDAKRGDCKRCLVANALKRVTGQQDVVVGQLGNGSIAAFDQKVYRFAEGARIIQDFDRSMDREKLLGRSVQITLVT